MTTTRRTIRSNGSRLGLVSALVACLFLITAAPVAAAGNIGRVLPGWGYCHNSTTVLVGIPAIDPAPVRYGATPLFGTPSQRVAWQANLSRSYDLVNWTPVRYGPWYYGTVHTSDVYGVIQTTWRTQAGQPMPWPIGYDRLASGTWQRPIYYRVWYAIHWFGDRYRPDGSTSVWAGGHQENRGGPSGTAILDQTAYLSCKFPGPNSIAYIRG